MGEVFKLEIRLGNDAMQDNQDVADALRAVADRLVWSDDTVGPVRDLNGNTVGEWSLDG